jgi:hypothetical protein
LLFRDVRAHLVDIRESIDNVDDFVKKMDFGLPRRSQNEIGS